MKAKEIIFNVLSYLTVGALITGTIGVAIYFIINPPLHPKHITVISSRGDIINEYKGSCAIDWVDFGKSLEVKTEEGKFEIHLGNATALVEDY